MPYISTALVGVVIFDEHLYRPTGLVGFWMNKVTMRFVAESIAAAPKDTGRLASGISGDVHQIGVRLVQGRLSSSAPYTMFVVRGTGFPVKGHGGRIYTTKGFVTQNPDDAYVTLWGIDKSGKFSRKGKGKRTRHRIRKRGYWLKLPFPGRNGGNILTFSVRGQEPNNFFARAWRRTARNHSALPRTGAVFPNLPG
jgi:hypothetical protein